MIKSVRRNIALLILLSLASVCQAPAQTPPPNTPTKAKPASPQQSRPDQLPLVIPSSRSACTNPPPPPTPCCRNVCLAGDNSWDQFPLPAGKKCAENGYCDGSSCDCNIQTTGFVYPSYMIASLFYVPPSVGSYVDYGSGTTIGTTISTTESWQNSQNVTVSVGASFLGWAGAQLSFDFGDTWNTSTTTSIDIVGSVSQDMQAPAAPSESIDHNYDQIMLLLGPRVIVSSYEGQIQWAMDISQALPQVVRVGWLNGTIEMPSAVAGTLANYGITSSDYGQMLSVDPYANDSVGNGPPDPTRFAYLTVVPYEPTLGDRFNWKGTNNYSTSTTNTTSLSLSVGATIGGDFPIGSLKETDKFTWTNSSSQKNTKSNSDSDTFSIVMPSAAYTGPTDLYVYVDTMYKTFLFSFVSPAGKQTSRYKLHREAVRKSEKPK